MTVFEQLSAEKNKDLEKNTEFLLTHLLYQKEQLCLSKECEIVSSLQEINNVRSWSSGCESESDVYHEYFIARDPESRTVSRSWV